MLGEHREHVAVVVALLDQPVVGRRGPRLALVAVGGGVELCDRLPHRQRLERLDGVLGHVDRAAHLDVQLVSDAVDRHAVGEQVLHEAQVRRTLVRVLRVVVVDEQQHLGAERVTCVAEGVGDVRLAEDAVPLAAAQAVGLVLVDDLVDDVEGEDRVARRAVLAVLVAVVVGDRLDVRAQALAQQRPVGGRRRQGRAVALEEPGRRLLVPQQRVAVDAHVVLERPVDQAVGGGEGERALDGLDRLRLHLVAGRDLLGVVCEQVAAAAEDVLRLDRDAERHGHGLVNGRHGEVRRVPHARDQDVVDHDVDGRGHGLDVQRCGVEQAGRVGRRHLLPLARDVRDRGDRLVRRLPVEVTLDGHAQVGRAGAVRQTQPQGDGVRRAGLEQVGHGVQRTVPRVDAVGDQQAAGAAGPHGRRGDARRAARLPPVGARFEVALDDDGR